MTRIAIDHTTPRRNHCPHRGPEHRPGLPRNHPNSPRNNVQRRKLRDLYGRTSSCRGRLEIRNTIGQRSFRHLQDLQGLRAHSGLDLPSDGSIHPLQCQQDNGDRFLRQHTVGVPIDLPCNGSHTDRQSSRNSPTRTRRPERPQTNRH